MTLANTELLLKLFDGVEGRKTNCRLKRGRSVGTTNVTSVKLLVSVTSVKLFLCCMTQPEERPTELLVEE